MKFPNWLRFKKEKDGVLIYNLQTRRFYFSQSNILYLLLKNLFDGRSVHQAIASIAKSYNLPYPALKAKVMEYYHQIENLVNCWKTECDSCNYNYNFTEDINFDSPLVVSLILTYKCNLHCKHCLFGSFRFSKMKEMDIVALKRLAGQMEQYEVFKVILNGGEPTVRKDFFNILEIFCRSRIPVELVTNGVGLTREKIELMNEYGVVIYNLSIEGKDDTTHDLIRGTGNFREVCNTLCNLKKYSKAFEINVEVTYGRHNIAQVNDIIKLMDNLGVSSVKFARLKSWDWGEKLRALVPNKDEIAKVNKEIWNLRGKYSKIHIGGDIPHDGETKHKFGCNVNIGFEIQPDGNVIPCRIFEQNRSKMLLGNVMNDSIIKIWNSKKAKDIKAAAKRLNSNILCQRCSFYYFCPTNYCIAENYIMYNKLIPSKWMLKCYKS